MNMGFYGIRYFPCGCVGFGGTVDRYNRTECGHTGCLSQKVKNRLQLKNSTIG